MLSENQTTGLYHCGHSNKTTKNDRKLYMFTTESRSLITEFTPNFSATD